MEWKCDNLYLDPNRAWQKLKKGTDYMNCNLTLGPRCLRVLITPSQGSSENVKGQPRPGTPAGQGWGDSVVKRRLNDKISCGAASDQSDLIINWWHAVAFPKFNCELRLCKRCFPYLSSSRPCLGAKVSKAALCSFSPKRHRNFQPLPRPDGCCSPRERRLPGGPLGPRPLSAFPDFSWLPPRSLPISLQALNCPCQDLCWQLHVPGQKASYLVHVSELTVFCCCCSNTSVWLPVKSSTPQESSPSDRFTPRLGGGGGETQHPDQ